jgi:hypothetical protein
MKVYKILENNFSIAYSSFFSLKKDDILIIEKCTISITDYHEYKDVNILTKLIRDGESKSVNIVDPRLQYSGLHRSYKDFEFISKEGIKERISVTLNGYYAFKPIEDITVQYIRNEKLKELGI